MKIFKLLVIITLIGSICSFALSLKFYTILQGSIKAHTKDMAHKDIVIKELSQKQETFQRTLNEKESEIKQLLHQIKETEKTIEKLKNDILKLQDDNSYNKQLIEEKEKKISDLQKDRDLFAKKLTDAQLEIDRLAKLAAVAEEIPALKAQKQDLQQKYDALITETKQLSDKVSQYETQPVASPVIPAAESKKEVGKKQKKTSFWATPPQDTLKEQPGKQAAAESAIKPVPAAPQQAAKVSPAQAKPQPKEKEKKQPAHKEKPADKAAAKSDDTAQAQTAAAPVKDKLKEQTIPKKARGKVLTLNRTYNFVILDIGKNDGIEIGTVLIVYRVDQFVAKVQVEKVYDSLSSATILKDWTVMPVAEGDSVGIL